VAVLSPAFIFTLPELNCGAISFMPGFVFKSASSESEIVGVLPPVILTVIRFVPKFYI
jgi:hypothetical protein